MDELYAVFGSRLREARQLVDLTQEDLAGRVGLSRPSISNIEKGRQAVTLRIAVDLAGAVGCRLSGLLPRSPSSDYAIPPKKLRHLPQDDREVVVQIVKGATGSIATTTPNEERR